MGGAARFHKARSGMIDIIHADQLEQVTDAVLEVVAVDERDDLAVDLQTLVLTHDAIHDVRSEYPHPFIFIFGEDLGRTQRQATIVG